MYQPARAHMLGLLPGDKFTFSLEADAEIFTFAYDGDGTPSVIDGSGQLHKTFEIARRNGCSYFVYVFKSSKERP